MKVGLVTYSQSRQVTASDALLIPPLTNAGVTVEAVPWDDPSINWKQFDTLILRSTWNFHRQLPQFLAWVEMIETSGIGLWNPPACIRWNAHKTYLFELERLGVTIIPSIYVAHDQAAQFHPETIPWEDLILKPVVGANSAGVRRLARKTMVPKNDIQTDTLIQPYIKEIEHGELSLIFFGHHYSHAVKKTKEHNSIKRFFGPQRIITSVEVPPALVATARSIVEKVSGNLAYARVDGIIVNGTFMLMELELIEPHLFLDYSLPAPDLFVQNLLNPSA